MPEHPNPVKCNVCEKKALWLDTEYHEYYCQYHAEVYEVFKGPHRRVSEDK